MSAKNVDIDIIKVADKSYAHIGDTITYSFYVENTGDVPLYNVAVVDDKIGSISLEKTNLKYALTTYQAETLTQNYLFPSRIDLYIKEEDIEEWHRLFIKNGLIGKGNVKIIIDDKHVFYKSKQKKGFEVVSIPQLIVDLLKEGGVAEEAAIMLMRKKYNEIIS